MKEGVRLRKSKKFHHFASSISNCPQYDNNNNINIMKTTIRKLFSSSKCFIDQNLQNFTIQSETKLENVVSMLSTYTKNSIDMTYMKSRISSSKNHNKINCLDISIKKLSTEQNMELRQKLSEIGATINQEKPIQIPWFPRKVSDLNLIGKYLFEQAGDQGCKDHPQLTDLDYRKRRDFIAQSAQKYKMGDRIEDVPYTKEQNNLWVDIYQRLNALHPKIMSQRYLHQKENLEKELKISKQIPQLNQLSNYLKSRTGVTIKPTHGILSQREFLNCLAFKVFCSTQYIRHVSDPEYTPEPDIVHEIMGHIPMFADPFVAEISQKIGLLSLGATDQQIKMLGTLYIFTIEFGVELLNNRKVAYGAGIAGCAAEIKHFLSNKSVFKKFNPKIDAKATYPLQTVQPSYRYTESFEEALQQLNQLENSLIFKPVTTRFNQKTGTIQYNRSFEGIDADDKPIQFI